MRIEAEVEASEYANMRDGVPGVVHDSRTVPGWHLNVIFLGDRDSPTPYEFLVFSPERAIGAGDLARLDEDWRLVWSASRSTLGGEEVLPMDVLERLKDMADEYDVVLTGLGL